MHTATILDDFGRNLEESFFLQRDKKLIERLQALKRMEQSKKTLSEVSGIKSDAILQKLVDLDVHAELVAPLAIIPLIEVAWADGSVDEKGRKAVLRAAEAQGIRPGDVEYGLLETWLARRPEPALLTAWKHYIEGLCAELSPIERTTLRDNLLERVRGVAEASGGFSGLGNPVSKREAAMLRTLEESFNARV
jgi:hypothetical protein